LAHVSGAHQVADDWCLASHLSFLRYHARDMATKQKVDILKWAHLGAASRLRELDEERSAILKTFPGLTSGSGPARRGVTARAVGAGSGSVSAPVARKRRKMSAAARKRISDAQKKRWAAQKAGKG
jgi:hypothetical protein